MFRNINITKFTITLLIFFASYSVRLHAKPIDNEKTSKFSDAILKIDRLRQEKYRIIEDQSGFVKHLSVPAGVPFQRQVGQLGAVRG